MLLELIVLDQDTGVCSTQTCTKAIFVATSHRIQIAIAHMHGDPVDVQNNEFFILWELSSIFMQTISIVF